MVSPVEMSHGQVYFRNVMCRMPDIMKESELEMFLHVVDTDRKGTN